MYWANLVNQSINSWRDHQPDTEKSKTSFFTIVVFHYICGTVRLEISRAHNGYLFGKETRADCSYGMSKSHSQKDEAMANGKPGSYGASILDRHFLTHF